jgi:hypothetical protein
MITKTEFERICHAIFLKYYNFFDTTNTRVENYINTDNGEITFKLGLIPNMELYKDISFALGVNFTECDETYT